MPVLPPNAIQGVDADAAQVANVIDPVELGAAQALPPPVSAIPPLPVDALMTAASVPPLAAVDPFAGDAVDQTIAPALAAPPALSLVPPVAPPTSPTEAAQRNVTRADELGAEQVANAEEKARLDVEKTAEEAKLATKKAEALAAITERQDAHRAEAEARTAAARAKAEAEPFHTFWETRSIGQNIATGIGLILGGVSWNANHVNRGVQLLQGAIEQDLALQKAKHADLWRAVEAAEKGESVLDQSQLREVARFNAVEAAKHDAVASRLSAAAAMNKGKGDITTAKKIALDEADKANQHWQLAATADATAKHQAEMDAETKRHHAEQEKTALIRANKYKTKGGGGTGSGGAREQAAITLTQEIQDAKKAGKPMSMADIDRRAVELKIPLIGKANQITARTIAADAAKEVAAEAKADHVDAVMSEKDDARTVHWNGKDWLAPRANQVKDIAKDIANMEKYTDLIHEVSEDIRKNGFIVDPGGESNPMRESAKKRMTLMAEIQALGRQISALQATDAGQKLEHQMIGHAGVGLKPGMASPEVLEELGARAKKLVDTKFSAMLTPRKTKGEGGAAATEFPPKILDGIRYTYDPAKGKYIKDVVKL